VVAFLGYWCAGLLLIALVPALAGAAVHATVLTFSRLLALLRWPHQVADSVFLLGGAALEIVTDCTPLMPVVAFASAVLAYPARASSRLAACVAGFMILSGFNLARLLVLAVVLERAPWLFEFLHVYLWQTMTLFVVFLLFAGWLRTLAARVDAA
jgi:exosortase/archaeosortase family protein